MKAVAFHILVGLLVIPNAYSSVPVTDFFPYGTGNGDSQLPVGDDSFVKVTLQQSSIFNFFKSTYDSLFVNNNGAISFVRGISQFTPNCKPQSVPMIVPFWADVDTRNGGTVHYRETTDQQFLLKANEEIRTGFPNLNNINVGWAFVATWDNVAFYGANSDCGGLSKRNTFQTILTTDGTQSFVIFFYDTVTWTTGIASNGNCGGLGGFPAKAGFDIGDGNTFSGIGGSCTDAVVNIASTTNVGQPGKWIFKIDNELQHADCPKPTLEQLKISPSFVSIFGNNPITVQGPYIVGSIGLQCRFNDKTPQTVNAVISSFNVATCNVPYLYKNGKIKVELLVTRADGTVETFLGYVYTIIPRNQLIFSQTTTFEFKMSWDKSLLAGGDATQLLDLELVELAGGIWTSRGIIKEDILNTGSFSGSINRQKEDAIRLLRNVCLVKLSIKPPLERSLLNETNSINSNMLLLLGEKTQAEVDAICHDWYIQDTGAPTDAEPCPPTLEHAMADQRFEEVDDLSTYNPGGQYGYRQSVPSPSGAGQRCTYRNGQIIVNSPDGGNVRKFSPNGEFNLVNYAQDDIMPWYFCCQHTTNSTSCDYYNERRPISDGSGYIPNQPVTCIGDPHIITFDGVYYDFYGVGEYWMIKDDSFSMQARTGPYGAASVCTAFVLQQRNCPNNVVTIQLSLEPNGIEIMIDGDKVIMDDPNQPKRTIIHNGALITIVNPRNIKIAFSAGYTFDFTDGRVVIDFIASASAKLKGKPKGLLGFFDGVYNNDLMLPDGQVINAHSTFAQYHDFGMQWSINAENSLFSYPPCKSFNDYQDVNFVPNYLPNQNVNVPQEAVDACKGFEPCLFDLFAAGDAALGISTREGFEKFNKTNDLRNTVVGVCPKPIAPVNGNMVYDNYLVGSTAVVVCNENYKVDGNSMLICKTDSRGEPSWIEECGKCIHVCKHENAYLQLLCETNLAESTTMSTPI